MPPPIVLVIMLAFFFGYALTIVLADPRSSTWAGRYGSPSARTTRLDRHHGGSRQPVHHRLPGALAAGLTDGLFWWSLVVSLAVAFVVTVPINRWPIARGKGHAVVHGLH